jgi:hypothetical protein
VRGGGCATFLGEKGRHVFVVNVGDGFIAEAPD